MRSPLTRDKLSSLPSADFSPSRSPSPTLSAPKNSTRSSLVGNSGACYPGAPTTYRLCIFLRMRQRPSTVHFCSLMKGTRQSRLGLTTGACSLPLSFLMWSRPSRRWKACPELSRRMLHRLTERGHETCTNSTRNRPMLELPNGMGFTAHIMDPDGNVLGVWSQT